MGTAVTRVPSGASASLTALRTAPGGFQPGKIYELVYRARDPVVVGRLRELAQEAMARPLAQQRAVALSIGR